MKNNLSQMGNKFPKVAFVISSLGCGGAEKVLSMIANYFSSKGYDVSIITFDSPSQKPFFALSEKVNIFQTDMLDISITFASKIRNFLRRVITIRRLIKQLKPDIVISFMDRVNVITLIATRFLKIPVIVCERSDPVLCYPGRFWNILRIITYFFSCKIVVQTKYASKKFSIFLRKKIVVIPNPVKKVEKTGIQRKDCLIVGMGRFTEEKNFELVIEAFSKVKNNHPGWYLEIYGEGPLRKKFELMVKELGIADSVKFPGITKNVDEVFQTADIFVLCSKYEGFPNVLCEAMANGCACISTDCSGISEIITDNYDGVIVEPDNPEKLKNAIECLIVDREKRRKLGENAEKISVKFDAESILQKWLSIVEQCLFSR